MPIVVIGSVFLDIKGFPSEALNASGRNPGTVMQVHGGVARNVAENLGNLGMRPIFFGLTDDSAFGTEIVDHLSACGVDTSYMQKTRDGMGIWLAVFNENGDVFTSISKRPDLLPIGRIVREEGMRALRSASAILLELDLEEDTLDPVLETAKKEKIPVYACVSQMRIAAQRKKQLPEVDCLVCNLQEAEMLFREKWREPEPEQVSVCLANAAKAAQIRGMIVTMGEKGAVFYHQNGEVGYVPAEEALVRDTTGAGDAFFSGVAAALSVGHDMRSACRIGTRMASACLNSTENVCTGLLAADLGLV